MKKTNKRAKIITVIAIVTVIVFAGILIATNVIKNNNVNNESYLATANANSDLVASYIKSGVTIGGITGTLETIDVSNATATAEDVLEGKTFYAGSNEIKTGTMTNNGDWSTTINPGESINIPQGYHSGSGQVSVSESTSGSNITLVDSYSTSREGNLNYSRTISDDSKSVLVMVTAFNWAQTQVLPNPTISSGTLSVSDFSYFDASSNNRTQYPARVYVVNNIQTPFTITFASTSWTWGWGVKLYTVK